MNAAKILTLMLLGLAPMPAATLTVYLSQPGAQSSFLTAGDGAVTETFNNLSTGNRTADYLSAIGTYQLSPTEAFKIESAGQYGGADGSKFMTFGAQSGTAGPIVLDLNAAANYFGFWWSAGDPNNGITLYNQGQEIARFSSSTITGALSPKSGQLQAVSGSYYNNSQYYGNPNSGLNSGEAYAYVSLVATGITFDRIVFDNSGKLSTGFESDNHTVYAGTVTIPNTSVFLTELPISSPVPEPATWATTAFASLAIGFGLWRRKRT